MRCARIARAQRRKSTHLRVTLRAGMLLQSNPDRLRSGAHARPRNSSSAMASQDEVRRRSVADDIDLESPLFHRACAKACRRRIDCSNIEPSDETTRPSRDQRIVEPIICQARARSRLPVNHAHWISMCGGRDNRHRWFQESSLPALVRFRSLAQILANLTPGAPPASRSMLRPVRAKPTRTAAPRVPR